MKHLRTFVFPVGVFLLIGLLVSGALPWFVMNVEEYGTYNAYSAGIEDGGSRVPGAQGGADFVFRWLFSVPPGYVFFLSAVLGGIILAVSYRKPITEPLVKSSGIAIALIGVVNLAFVALNSNPWSSGTGSSYGARIPWSELSQLTPWYFLSLLLCVAQIAFGIYISLGLKLGWKAVMDPAPLTASARRRLAGNSEDARIPDANLLSNDQGKASNRTPDAMVALEFAVKKQSRESAVNAVLVLVVALIGLLPFFSIGALGMSESLNAFKADEGDGQRFWLTVVPVGWVMVAVSVVAFAVVAMASKKSSRSAKRIENYVLAGFGLIVAAGLVASWYYANKQIEDAMGAVVGELVADGNPFAALGGAMVGGISFSPAIGFWLMLAVALAIAGYNVFLIREAAKPTSSVAVTPNTTLANGIRELSELRDQGMISEEEFTLAKRKLLGE